VHSDQTVPFTSSENVVTPGGTEHVDTRPRKKHTRYSDEEPLWTGFNRRTKHYISPVDTILCSIAQTRMTARVMTGAMPGSLHLSPWPETNIAGLNELMQQTWEEAVGLITRRGDSTRGASSEIPGAVARKVRST
jgi:hypothetical protein